MRTSRVPAGLGEMSAPAPPFSWPLPQRSGGGTGIFISMRDREARKSPALFRSASNAPSRGAKRGGRGGGRASGTNDKAGSYLNLIRWTTMRAIKETFVPPTHFAYPFMGEE